MEHNSFESIFIHKLSRVTIRKKLGCSNAGVTGWLSVSLPQDIEPGIRFREEYTLNIKAWVYCETNDYADNGEDYVSKDRLAESIRLARSLEKKRGLSNEDQSTYCVIKLNAAVEPEKKLLNLDDLIPFGKAIAKNV